MAQPTTGTMDEIRNFNRFYTRQIGALRDGLLHTSYSLVEGRVIYELAHRGEATATELARELGLDVGNLSRIISRLDQQGVLEKERSEIDGRRRLLRLTEEGKRASEIMTQRSREEVTDLLSDISDEDQVRLVAAMRTIMGILDRGGGFKFAEPYVIRQHEPGDMGWIVHRHGVLYRQDYGWDDSFEAVVAQNAADFMAQYNSARERCWIAEMDGEIIGSLALRRADETAAELGLLLVEPRVRGLGIGSRLVQEGIRFARRAGYRTLIAGLQSVFVEARHIFEKNGFLMIGREAHHSYGQTLVEEKWELSM